MTDKNEKLRDFYEGQDIADFLDLYSGNPDYSKVLADGVDPMSITLDDLGFNIDGVKNELYGALGDIVDPNTGKPYPDSLYETALLQAVSLAESTFDIVIRPRFVRDRVDYDASQYNSYCYVKLEKRPIITVKNVKLYYNDVNMVDFPMQWLKVYNKVGQLQIQPSLLMHGMEGTVSSLLPLINTPMNYYNPFASYNSLEFAPQILGVSYLAGMLPENPEYSGIYRDVQVMPLLQSWVNKNAAISILEKFGRAILTPGIAGYNVSYDGASVGIQTTASAENSATSGEIHNLQEDLEPVTEALMNAYGKYGVQLL